MGLGSRHNFIKKCPCFLICKTGMGVVSQLSCTSSWDKNGCSISISSLALLFHEVRLSSVHGGGGKPLTSNEA